MAFIASMASRALRFNLSGSSQKNRFHTLIVFLSIEPIVNLLLSRVSGTLGFRARRAAEVGQVVVVAQICLVLRLGDGTGEQRKHFPATPLPHYHVPIVQTEHS